MRGGGASESVVTWASTNICIPGNNTIVLKSMVFTMHMSVLFVLMMRLAHHAVPSPPPPPCHGGTTNMSCIGVCYGIPGHKPISTKHAIHEITNIKGIFMYMQQWLQKICSMHTSDQV